MVYVGKRGDGTSPDSDGEVRIPPRYSGNAFGRANDGGEALRHAEELFRRGYVFDNDAAGIIDSGMSAGDSGSGMPSVGSRGFAAEPTDADRVADISFDDSVATIGDSGTGGAQLRDINRANDRAADVGVRRGDDVLSRMPPDGAGERAPGRRDYIEPPRFGEPPRTGRNVGGRQPNLAERRQAPTERRAAPSAAAVNPRPQRGLLSDIFEKITTEEILIGALILVLYLNGTDDELLIMLAILLFC